jgi:hypothetical protein
MASSKKRTPKRRTAAELVLKIALGIDSRLGVFQRETRFPPDSTSQDLSHAKYHKTGTLDVPRIGKHSALFRSLSRIGEGARNEEKKV